MKDKGKQRLAQFSRQKRILKGSRQDKKKGTGRSKIGKGYQKVQKALLIRAITKKDDKTMLHLSSTSQTQKEFKIACLGK